jgi:hypothetical protein
MTMASAATLCYDGGRVYAMGVQWGLDREEAVTASTPNRYETVGRRSRAKRMHVCCML